MSVHIMNTHVHSRHTAETQSNRKDAVMQGGIYAVGQFRILIASKCRITSLTSLSMLMKPRYLAVSSVLKKGRNKTTVVCD